MGIAPIVATMFGAAVLVCPLAPAQPRSDPIYPPITALQRAQTLPLVKIVLAAHKSGNASPLCDVFSLSVIHEKFATRALCQSAARKLPPHPCKTCSYRIWKAFGVYRTASDRRQKRKTISWLVAVKGSPEFVGISELELRFVPERGRWVLTTMLWDGLAR